MPHDSILAQVIDLVASYFSADRANLAATSGPEKIESWDSLSHVGLVSLTGMMIGAKARGLFARLAAAGVVVLGLWTLYEGAVFFDIMRGLGNW